MLTFGVAMQNREFVQPVRLGINSQNVIAVFCNVIRCLETVIDTILTGLEVSVILPSSAAHCRPRVSSPIYVHLFFLSFNMPSSSAVRAGVQLSRPCRNSITKFASVYA